MHEDSSPVLVSSAFETLRDLTRHAGRSHSWIIKSERFIACQGQMVEWAIDFLRV